MSKFGSLVCERLNKVWASGMWKRARVEVVGNVAGTVLVRYGEVPRVGVELRDIMSPIGDG